MRSLKFKSQLTIILADLLGNRTTYTGSKDHGLWPVIGGFRSVWWVSVFQGYLLVIVIMTDYSEKRNCEGGFRTFWENMRKLAPARVSYRDDFFISYRVYIMTGSFHISLFEGTLHVDKIHVWFKIANITHALPVPVYRQTDFTPKRVVVSRLHDTVARFRTGVKFSPRYNNRGELTPGWLAPAWHFVVVSCKLM